MAEVEKEKEKNIAQFCIYDPSREREAEKTINELKDIFKENAADIQHIGGTSMKKIKSRPIIDIIVGVHDLNSVDVFKNALRDKGFIFDSKNSPDRKLLYKSDAQKKKTHVIYIVPYSGKLWFDYIIFRDYMNLNDNKAREYESLKLSVNGKYKYAVPSYIKAKSDYINKIISENFYTMMLGKNVTVKLDCGTSSNYPKYSDGIFPLNCGRIKYLKTNAYVIGVYDYALSKEFNGKIIAYIIGKNKNADNKPVKSFIVAKENMVFYKPEIYEAMKFYLNGSDEIKNIDIVCLHEKSCGAVVYTKDGDDIKFLLVKGSASNSVGFPKGHVEKNETEAETAIREIYEETSLNVVLHSDFKEEYEYTVRGYIHKKVVCFIAEFKASDKYKIRDLEILEQWLLPYEKAYEMLTFIQAKTILKNAYQNILKNM